MMRGTGTKYWRHAQGTKIITPDNKSSSLPLKQAISIILFPSIFFCDPRSFSLVLLYDLKKSSRCQVFAVKNGSAMSER